MKTEPREYKTELRLPTTNHLLREYLLCARMVGLDDESAVLAAEAFVATFFPGEEVDADWVEELRSGGFGCSADLLETFIEIRELEPENVTLDTDTRPSP